MAWPQRGGVQSLQWYHDSNCIPVYRYTGIQGLQIVYRRLQVGIQVRRSTQSLQKVYGYHTCALKQEAETQQTNSEAQKNKPRQRRAFCSSAFNVFWSLPLSLYMPCWCSILVQCTGQMTCQFEFQLKDSFISNGKWYCTTPAFWYPDKIRPLRPTSSYHRNTKRASPSSTGTLD